MFRFLRLRLPGTVSRISIGLISLLVLLAILLEFFLGTFSQQAEDARNLRLRVTENVALQITSAIQASDLQSATQIADQLIHNEDTLLSIGIRNDDNALEVDRGMHSMRWNLPEGAQSTMTQIRVPIASNEGAWGNIELVFTPSRPGTLADWLRDPLVLSILLFVLIGTFIIYFYLRRTLQHLDPSMVVPQRVRAAFDTLLEGVILLDAQQRIVLVNDSFIEIAPKFKGSLIGKPVESLKWLTENLSSTPDDWPWRYVAKERQVIERIPVDLSDLSKTETSHLLMSAAPILDDEGRYRGCILSLSDVSELHRMNNELRSTIEALDASNQQIQEQNAELQRLATTDPLTGCLNRRAFYQRLSEIASAAKRTNKPVSCLMTDIDFFKRFNDTYGHAVGDQVLIAVSEEFKVGIREHDVLARFGGEEFCVVFPDLNLDEAVVIAERLRIAIEKNAGEKVEADEKVTVTSSFGVSSLNFDTMDTERMIQLADEALYVAKETGRNRVATERELPDQS